MATREPIYAALAALVFNDARMAVFPTKGRLIRQVNQVNSDFPAIYLVQQSETHQRAGKGIPNKRTLYSLFVMYFKSADASDALPATLCNIGLDVIDDVCNLPNNPGNVQNLGGLVEHVYTEGKVVVAEGILQEFSIVTVPITILIP